MPRVRRGDGAQAISPLAKEGLWVGEEILPAWKNQFKNGASFTQIRVSDKLSFLASGPK